MPHGTTTAPQSAMSAITGACPSRESLRGYLSGWTDEDDSLRIEDHLTQCGNCEQVITEVENEPESMVLEIESADTQKPLDSIVSYALSLAKRQPSFPDGSGSTGIGSDGAENGLHPADGTQQSLPTRVPMVASEIGPYELIRSLGHGGMGSVYLARHRELDKLVAIKVFPARWLGNDHHQTRFKREIRAAGGLNHSAIVTATDAGQVDDIHYLVMEFIDGMDLSRTTRLCGPLGIADACETMRRVALGLSHAHASGIVHRDIKPSNLMLSTAGDVKILDFGLARHSLWDEASAELTTVGQLMGTLDYMAPEQAECAAAVDYRADLYSLGATLFRLLAGRPPLAAAPDLSPLTKLRLLGTTCPPRIDTLRTDVPKALVEFIATLLHRSPDQRPASAAHVAERLADFSANHNLAALAEQAQQKLSTSPSVDSPSIEPFTRASSPARPNVPAQKSGSGRGGRYWKWLVVAAALPAFIFAGILFIVETQKGQLVIESDAENISIQLLSDGQVYDTVKVVPGATSTRLLAGRYEITIAGAAEDFQIDHESVEIRRGETIIARVRRADSKADATSEAADTIASATSPARPQYFSEEWVYEGKSLSAWMEQLAVERSPTELYKAIDAIKALTGSANAEEVVNALYATLKTVENQSISSETRKSTVDFEVFRILVEAAESPAAFYDRLVQELKTADTQWAKRLFAGASRGDEAASSALVDWIVTGELGSDRDPDRAKSAADFIRIYLFTIKLDQAGAERLVDALFASQQLGDEFWLEVLPNDWSTDQNTGYENVPMPFLKAMQLKSIEIFVAENGDPGAVAKAAIILRRLADPMYATSLPITDQQQQTVFDLIDKRLSVMAMSQDTLGSATTLERQYFSATLPSTLSLSFFSMRFSSVSIDRNPSRPVSNAIILLNLAKSIQRPGQYLPASETICRGLEEIITKDYRPEEIAVRSRVMWKDLAITWPLPTNSNAALEPPLAFLIYAGAFETLSDSQKQACERRFLSTTYDIAAQSDFQKRDADQNGSLTDVELEDFMDWKTYDTNGDGEISGSEHRAMTEKKLSEMAIRAEGVPTIIDPKYLAYAERVMSRSDKDGDGVLSEKERRDMLMDISAADMNQDGFITVAEYALYMQKKAGGR